MNKFEVIENYTEANSSGIVFTRRNIDGNSTLKTDLKTLFPKEISIFSKDKYKRIISFVGKHSASIDDYKHRGRTLRVLNLSIDPPLLGPERVWAYLDEQEEANANGIYRNCILISENAVKKRTISGRIYSDYLTKRLIGWANHAMNYEYLSDGSFLGVDFTASSYIDKNAGNFHTLALRTSSFAGLRSALSELYGGDWRDYPIQNYPIPIHPKISSLYTI